ncbi:MAG: YiiX/YebB-like N1pC/P60 family cysteine hydrolase [Flavobacteriales bacterium]|nr:YiiX/YebB-like N1pC/P60 family cysteine hydrolase [Flavobacteriales bacterium]MDW8431998.1 YiiX/YebB-like N1pC/P60 family cysteine hydrolase [Flavobacteriales bacterium]
MLPLKALHTNSLNRILFFKAGTLIGVPAYFFVAHFLLIFFKTPDIPPTASQEPYRLSAEETALLKEGDIIMRRGHGFVSSVINELFQTGYNLSHCAFVAEENGRPMVIHTVSSELSGVDGMQMESLEKFVEESVRGTILAVRLKKAAGEAALPVMYARQFLARRIPFDDKFDLADTTKLYCTELIYLSYLKAFKKDLFTSRFQTDHPNFLSLSALLDTTLFEVVINHQAAPLPAL